MSYVPYIAPLPVANVSQLLFVIRSADMQLTTDQALTKVFTGTKYRVLDVIAVRKAGGASVACAGGVYDAASKGGNALVSTAQSWVTLATTINVVPTLAAVAATTVLAPTLYLSLTTGSTAACTADVFVYGYVVD
jgi:hypothetical protein